MPDQIDEDLKLYEELTAPPKDVPSRIQSVIASQHPTSAIEVTEVKGDVRRITERNAGLETGKLPSVQRENTEHTALVDMARLLIDEVNKAQTNSEQVTATEQLKHELRNQLTLLLTNSNPRIVQMTQNLFRELDRDPDEVLVLSNPASRRLLDINEETPMPVVMEVLQGLNGVGFKTLKANQFLTRLINSKLKTRGQRVACCSCKDKPALLRCLAVKGIPRGVFYFQHPIDDGKSTLHGGFGTIPLLQKLVTAPADLRKKSK